MASIGRQNLKLALCVHHATVDTAAKLVRRLDSEAQALAVAMQAGGHKLSIVAAAIGKSEAYVSRLRSRPRPIPEKLVRPLCAATGSNLLAQYRAMQEALGEVPQTQRLASMLAASYSQAAA